MRSDPRTRPACGVGCASTAGGSAAGIPAAAITAPRSSAGTSAPRSSGGTACQTDSWNPGPAVTGMPNGRRRKTRSNVRSAGRSARCRSCGSPCPPGPTAAATAARIERNSIALLSCLIGGPDKPSTSWLGHHVGSSKVRESGLWNSDHVDEHYDPGPLHLLADLAGNASCPELRVSINGKHPLSPHGRRWQVPSGFRPGAGWLAASLV